MLYYLFWIIVSFGTNQVFNHTPMNNHVGMVCSITSVFCSSNAIFVRVSLFKGLYYIFLRTWQWHHTLCLKPNSLLQRIWHPGQDLISSTKVSVQIRKSFILADEIFTPYVVWCQHWLSSGLDKALILWLPSRIWNRSMPSIVI